MSEKLIADPASLTARLQKKPRKSLGLAIMISTLVVAVLIGVVSMSAVRSNRLNTAFSPSIRDTLLNSSQFVVFSLHPRPRELEPADLKKNGTFHTYMILGQAVVTSKQDRVKLLQSLYGGIASSDGNMAKCFFPRHGIRAASGGQTIDLVICFECLQMEIHLNNTSKTVGVSNSPVPVFNELLTQAKVPLARK